MSEYVSKAFVVLVHIPVENSCLSVKALSSAVRREKRLRRKSEACIRQS